jgi:hypothetical protein
VSRDADVVLTVVADAAANVGSGKVGSRVVRGVHAFTPQGGADEAAARDRARGCELGQATRESTAASTAARISDWSIKPTRYVSLTSSC